MNKKYLSKEEYISKLKNGDKTNLRHLLDLAMDIRKFEIELYWKRATYFWAFVSVFFVGYYQTIPKTTDEDINEKWIANLAIIIGGYLFSLGWYFVNKGSKFWQENWEKHIHVLSQELQESLFGLIHCNKYSPLNCRQSYPYSVSKVNQMLSLFVCVFWFGMIVLRAWQFGTVITIIACITAVVIPVVFHFSARSFASKIRNSQEMFFDNYN